MDFPQQQCLLLLLLFAPLSQALNMSSNSFLLASDDSSPLTSPSGDFAFGFRRLEHQELFLLAIWFDKIPEKTMVWHANPAPEQSRVELTSNGQFRLIDPQGQVMWKPESVVDGIAYAALLDSGNLVLVNKSSGYAWQSFTHPVDTILPCQVLESGSKLFSKQTQSNYSTGRFQLRLIPGGNMVLYTISLPSLPSVVSYSIYYDLSDHVGANNSTQKLVFHQSGYLYQVLRNGNVVNVTLGNNKILPTSDYYHMVRLEFDGVLVHYAHPKPPANGSWSAIWSIPDDICSAMNGDLGLGSCGFSSYCILDVNSRPNCQCLPGFEYSDLTNKLSGCRQDRIQTCDPDGPSPESMYEMQALENTFWPNTANYEQFQSDDEQCSRSCMEDCNCVVAAHRRGMCFKKKLPLTNGRINMSLTEKTFVKLPKATFSLHPPVDPDSTKEKETSLFRVGCLLLGGSVFINFILISAVLLFVFFFYKRKGNAAAEQSSIMETNLRSFSYTELREATGGFREELGRGAFGTVYKGVLLSRNSTTCIAVKKLEKVIRDGEKEFKAEASAIGRTHHKNLVRLLGLCDQGPHKLLVYEFMSNGTLASFLFGTTRPEWSKRVQMALGIARGLLYLHEECATPVLHCDIKPQNILIDDSYTARISDFGLAKLLGNEQTRTLTAIRGTRGYVAPEWFKNQPVSVKVDVYSYGVMLLEMVCCRRSLDVERENEDEVILADWAHDCYAARRVEKLVEGDEEARSELERVERFVMVGIWCIQEDPAVRPSMKMVLHMLEGVADVAPPPRPFI